MLFSPVYVDTELRSADSHPRLSQNYFPVLAPISLPLIPYPPKSFPLYSFADPHPLNPFASILYKNIGGRVVHSCLSSKFFSCHTCTTPRKCCKQKTYVAGKSFKCNTYKKHRGWGCPVAFSPFSFFLVSRRRENQAQFDQSVFRVIRLHKLMVRALASSENGMRRRLCPRAAPFFFAPCSECSSSAGSRGESSHHHANPAKASLRSSSSSRLLSRPTRLTRPRRPPICRPSPQMKARSAIPIFYRAPVSAASLGKPIPHTPPSPSRRSR